MIGTSDGNKAIRVSHSVIEKVPFFAKATGRLLAAMADEGQLKVILRKHGYPREHWNGIVDEQTLSSELEAVRRQGFCEFETGDGLFALACPISGAEGRTWGVVGAYAPAFRCDSVRRKLLLKSLRDCTVELSKIVAYPQEFQS